MAVAIPIIAAWGAVYGGAAIAGMTIAAYAATTAGFLVTAGAALTTVGALTKKQDLMKIGGFMQLGGGIATAYNAAASGAAANASAQEAANAAWQTGGQAEAAYGAQEAANAAWQAGGQAEVANTIASGAQSFAPVASSISEPISQSMANAASSAVVPDIPTPGTSISSFGSSAPEPFSLSQKASSYNVPPLQVGADPISQGAGQMPGNEFKSIMQSLADKAGTTLKGVGKFMHDNPELVKLGGNMLSSMYGPEAETLDFKKSIYNRQMQNMNSPIRLGLTGG